MGPRLVLVAFTLTALCIGLFRSVVHGADGGLLILAPADPYTVEFAIGTAKLELTVQNASDRLAALHVSLFDGLRNLTVDATTPPNAGGVAINATPGPLAAGEIKKIEVTLHAGGDVDVGKFKGVVVVSAPGISAATLNLVGAKAPGQFTVAKTQPASVTMTVTRLWPSLVPIPSDRWMPELWDVDAPQYEVFISGVLTEPLPKNIDTYLSSDTGGRLPIQLKDFAAAAGGLRAIVRLGDSDRAGKYTGKFLLDAKDDKAPTVDMTVNVQDLVLWPLLVLLGGAWLASLIASRRDRDRPRDVAEADLSRTHEVYEQFAKTASTTERSWMQGLFAGAAPTLAEQLTDRLKKAKTQEELGPVTNEITDFSALVHSWPALKSAADSLRKKAHETRWIDSKAAVFTYANSLLEARKAGFRTAAEAKKFLDQLNDQFAAIELVVRAHEFHSESLRLFKDLPPQQQAALRALDKDPAIFWTSQVSLRATKQELMDANIVGKSIDFLHAIRSYIARESAAIHADLADSAADEQMAALAADAEALGGWLALVDSNEIERRVIETLSPVQWVSSALIVERIKALDRQEFLVLAGAAIGIFLVALYIDKNFGTFWNYVAVFLAAVSGTIAINWQLLPWYRKYTSIVAAKA
jgi:hypothetical protein